ncbi:MAG: hypothetical protein CM15mP79_2970 [Methanobacteriota archaeon]|nr:MAG: hypothetical protein CM15mP79_2970 [Euryarchaeota archaeon]
MRVGFLFPFGAFPHLDSSPRDGPLPAAQDHLFVGRVKPINLYPPASTTSGSEPVGDEIPIPPLPVFWTRSSLFESVS